MSGSMNPKKDLNSELESFRQQWISDLRSKDEPTAASTSSAGPSRPRAPSSSFQHPVSKSSYPPPSSGKKNVNVEDDDEYFQGRSFDELPGPSGHTLAEGPAHPPGERKLVSALDHFEEAMEKEAQGNMGDSLTLYRKAYKLDNGVDKRYREKHFPGGSKPHGVSHTSAAPASSSTTAAKNAAPSQPGAVKPDEEPAQPLSIPELLASFAGLSIEPSPPAVEGMPQPPCPIASVPDEILVHVLSDVAMHDIAAFARLSLVCKRLAYLVASEKRIWREVCLGSKFGFSGMRFHWNTNVDWTPREEQEEQADDGTLVSMRELEARRRAESLAVTHSLTPAVYRSWKAMFRHRPRIRFNGVYISTVNYIRSGQASTNQATWGGAPIHIVTYYRYLRFYRDGSVISLLTVSSPTDVVHHMTKELLESNRGRDRSHAHNLPSAVMQHGLKGRWRLSSAVDHPDASTLAEQEGDLYVETEGSPSKYIYLMDLSLRSAGKGARNNKLVWRSFHSYNKLTDDLAKFQMKNDKPFFFSRVKSFGFGE
ncbi:unnamed protein product [Clonostachys rosea]|uniref:F-box domain-containing protein n=1 Tax=Bionectria ochroleuca TaxID=29856 RepID=A0ABY6V067_BIOOC|nr:unnamed protein product [Clonostachys rosea]